MLATEDTLKLNVLICTCVAIRIDVYKLVVVGLSANKQERTIALNPIGDSDKYIKEVQKLLLNQTLGNMGSYASYLKRWNRMGQVSATNLSALLKLGNIEAVVAVSNSQSLDKSLLELVWWCATNTDQQAEIGCFLLSKKFVISQPVSKQIADYLLEFLPYTNDIQTLINTTNLILQGDLIDKNTKLKLWQQGLRKTAFLVGFIERMQGHLPNLDNTKALRGQPQELQKFSTEQGQILIKTCAHILKKINQEDVLYHTLEAIGAYFAHPEIKPCAKIQQLQKQAEDITTKLGFTENEKIKARFLLAGVNENLVISTICAHNITGSLIRKKMAAVLTPIQTALKILTD